MSNVHYWLVLVFSSVMLTSLNAQFPGAGSTQGGAPGGIRQTNFADTVQRPPFSYEAFDLYDQDIIDKTIIDTLLDGLHRVEPYLRASALGGNLGSEFSSTYPFFLDYNPNPLAIGQVGHQTLLSNSRSRMLVKPNRDYSEAVYGGSFPVSSGVFKLAYYKQFARGIVLNLDYRSMSDGGYIGPQDLSFKEVNIKFYQRSRSGRRSTYVHYDNPRITETIARTDSEGAVTFDQRRKVEFGNRLLLGDSTSIANQNVSVNSRLTFAKELYSINDAGVTDTEIALYGITLDGTSLSYTNLANRISFYNDYQKKSESSTLKFGIDLSTVSTTPDSIELPSYLTAQLLGNYKVTLGNNSSLEGQATLGLLDIAGDIRLNLSYQKVIKSFKLDVSMRADQMVPTLAQRGLLVDRVLSAQVTLDNVRRIGVNGSINVDNITLVINGGIDQYQNFIVPTVDGTLRQLSQSMTVARASIEKDLRFSIFRSKHRLHYQYISNPSVPRPSFQYHGNIYFPLSLFKKRMSTQWGVDVIVTPSFAAPAYQPLWQEWYQDANGLQSDDIIMVNPYLNIKVDRLQFFIKGINVTRQFLPQQPSWGGQYPINDYRVRFGLRWTLLD